ncbi:MAG: hypothetical protein V1777_05310 [Candidatus Micrarchaeota archaeon]
MAEKFNPGFFLRSVLFSYVNRIVLLVLGLAYVLLVANTLGPKLFGVYSYVLDFFGTVLLVLGMETFSDVLRVFLPKNRSAEFVKKIAFMQTGVALVIAAVVFWQGSFLSDFLAAGSGIPFEWVAVVVLGIPVSSLVYSVAVGNRQFGKLIMLSIVENASNVILALVLMQLMPDALLAVFMARAVSLGLLGLAGAWLLTGSLTEAPPSGTIVAKYGFQSWQTTLFKKIGDQAILIYVGIFVSAAALGFFYLLKKISLYIIEIPINAANEALLPFATGSGDLSFTEKLVSKNVKFYLVFSVLMALVLLLVTPILVAILFPSYSGGIFLVPLFALYYALSFDYPLGTFFRAVNKPKIQTVAFFYSAIASITVGYLLISRFLAEGLLLTMIFSRVLNIAVSVAFIRKSGYKIEFIPRKGDLVFFWELGISTVKKGIQKIR